jgi:flavorubredoxin
LNEWLQVAPNAKAVCSEVGAMVNMEDFAIRPAHAMRTNDILETGKYRYRFIHTPHLPHGWDAGVMFEETERTLLCSDLFHQNGDAVALTDKDILEAHRSSILSYEAGPLMDYTPYDHKTKTCFTAWLPLSQKPWQLCMAPPSLVIVQQLYMN